MVSTVGIDVCSMMVEKMTMMRKKAISVKDKGIGSV